MTAAEKLRKEMTGSCPFTKEEFIAAVAEAIKRQGRFSYYLNGRVERAYSLSGCEKYIPERYQGIVVKWATEEGFRVSRFTGAYEVPEYDVTL